jgi:hypothetical protein
MDYFAGLDISMDETHVCVLDREGVVATSLGRRLALFGGEVRVVFRFRDFIARRASIIAGQILP